MPENLTATGARIGLRKATHRLTSHSGNFFRPGIGVTLSISFGLVAVLAVTANYLANYRGWVITIVEQEPAPLFGQRPAVTTNARPLPATPSATVLSSSAVLSAVDQYERLTRWRAEIGSAEADVEWDASQVNLRRVVARYSEKARAVSPRLPSQLHQALTSYESAGQALVRAADVRRAALVTFSQEFELVNSRVQDALDGAWKIFGRVVARSSLVNLSDSLDKLRQHAGGLANELIDETTQTNLRSSERTVLELLNQNEKNFAKSYGDSWVSDLRSALEHMMTARETLERISLERTQVLNALQDAKASLHSAVPAKLTIPIVERSSVLRSGSLSVGVSESPRAPAHAQSQTPAFAESSSVLLMADAWSLGAVGANTGRRVSVNQVDPSGQIEAESARQRSLIGWLSACVLMVSILLSAWTVRSVTRPIRRLVDAARQLAMGMRPGAIERASLKELDTLTQAFNQMSEEIINARQHAATYQQQLESKVEERTTQLQYLAERDPLTLLPNRRQLFVLLNDAIAVARVKDRCVGVMFVDIDNFKNINDGMGHTFGDEILVAIGERLQATAQPFGFAARLGGDEFTVVYTDASRGDDIHQAGQRIIQAFQRPLLVNGRELHISASVGISVYPEHAADSHGLLQSADAALYRAKALGRNQMSIFTAELLKLAADKFATEQGLRRAIEAGQFELVFQPEINVGSLRIEVAEALIRWRLPDGRLIAPNEFLIVAEESGLICEIGDWVIRSAVAAASRWHHGAWPQARVAINVSPRQLVDPLFVEKLLAVLREYQLPHRCIEIELTETALQTCTGTIDTLKRLHSHGIAVTLDDFGTGYSSFSSLEQLPLSRVKLDRSLIDSIHGNPRSLAIVRAILTLCDGLDLAVTAEGIEYSEQFALLAGFSGISLQGYLFAKPVAADELIPAAERASVLAQELVLQARTMRRPAGTRASAETRKLRNNVIKLV